MTTKHHSTPTWSAAASLLIAFAIGSMPVAALLAFSEQMAALK
jgi:hypothetical protein